MLLLSFGLNAQELKTYTGKYDLNVWNDFDSQGIGTVTYQYYENSEFERVYNGTFNYKGKHYRSNYIVSGSYKENKKAGKWKFVKVSEKTTFTTQGVCDEGDMIGLWKWDVTSGGKTIKYFRVNFKNNILVGGFKFNGGDGLLIEGQFDNYGRFDGEWFMEYKENGVKFIQERRFKGGVLEFELYRNMSTGDIIRKYNIEKSPIKWVFDVMEKNQPHTYLYNKNDNSGLYIADKVMFQSIAFWIDNYWSEDNRYNASESDHHILKMFGRGSNRIVSYEENPKIQEKIKNEMNENLRLESINIADSLYKVEKFKSALDNYKRAVVFKSDKEIGDKIKLCYQKIKEINDLNYNKNISKANSLFNNQEYDLSLKIYTNALNYTSDEIQIKDIESQIQLVNNKLTELKYQNNIKDADSLFSKEKFRLAITKYNKALTIKPNEEYPIQQIKNAKVKLVELGEKKRRRLEVEKEKQRIEKIKTETGKLEKSINDYHSKLTQNKALTKKKKNVYNAYLLLYSYSNRINNYDDKLYHLKCLQVLQSNIKYLITLSSNEAGKILKKSNGADEVWKVFKSIIPIQFPKNR